MIVKWPHHGKENIVCDEPVISTDFYPTILEMLGLPFDPKKIDGKSFTRLLKGKEWIVARFTGIFHITVIMECKVPVVRLGRGLQTAGIFREWNRSTLQSLEGHWRAQGSG